MDWLPSSCPYTEQSVNIIVVRIIISISVSVSVGVHGISRCGAALCVKAGCGNGGGVTGHGRSETMSGREAECMERTGQLCKKRRGLKKRIEEDRRGGQGKARQGKARQGKARQGKARQGKARQGKARQGRA
jgi:hypothetical protein